MSAEQTLNRPGVTLFVNRSEESFQAFDILEQAEIGFTVIPSVRLRSPKARWGGYTARGITEIAKLAYALHNFETILIQETERSMPGFFDHPDPKLQEYMKGLREQQLSEAREVMQQLHKPPESNY